LPAASVIKIAILLELYLQAEEGLDLSERRPLREEDRTEGSGVLSCLKAGASLALEDLAWLMIIVSDNAASNMLIDRLGCTRINDRMQRLGYSGIQLQRRFFDLEARARGLDNRITAESIGRLLADIRGGTAAQAAHCERMLQILQKQQFQDRIPALLPPETVIGNKTGSIDGVCHDAAVIEAAAGPIVLVVLTEGSAPRHETEALIRRIAREIYDAWA
jgi:beta-lactamase class A